MFIRTASQSDVHAEQVDAATASGFQSAVATAVPFGQSGQTRKKSPSGHCEKTTGQQLQTIVDNCSEQSQETLHTVAFYLSFSRLCPPLHC